MKKLRFLFPFFCFVLFSSSAMAAEIVIEDTAGVVRHVSEIQASARIKFSVTDPHGNPLSGALVKLTSKDGSQTRQGVSVDGNVEFLDISAGHWVVSTDSSQLLFTQVDVGEFGSAVASMGENPVVGDSTVLAGGGTGGLTTGGMIGVGVLAAGGITGLAVSIDDSSSSKKTELSPIN